MTSDSTCKYMFLVLDGGQLGCVPLNGHVIIKARAIQKKP